MRNGSSNYNWHPGASSNNGQSLILGLPANANVGGWVASPPAQAVPAGLSRKVGAPLPAPHSEDAQDWLEWASLHA